MPSASGGLQGTSAAASAFYGTIDELTITLARALGIEAELVMTDAKENYVPVGHPPEDKTPGTLRASGFVLPPVILGSHIEVILGFGGAAEAYALVQHEHMEYHHTVGRSKYLEIPMLAAAAGLDGRLAAAIQRTSKQIKQTGHL